jgi:hypothetical protein
MLPHPIRILQMPRKTTNAAELDETCYKTARQLSPARGPKPRNVLVHSGMQGMHLTAQIFARPSVSQNINT